MAILAEAARVCWSFWQCLASDLLRFAGHIVSMVWSALLVGVLAGRLFVPAVDGPAIRPRVPEPGALERGQPSAAVHPSLLGVASGQVAAGKRWPKSQIPSPIQSAHLE